MNVNQDALTQAPQIAPTDGHREFTQEEAIYLRLTLKSIADMGKPRDAYHARDLYVLAVSVATIALDMVKE